ncbi:MAG: hypothetical protein AB6733_10780 [Clostridiaceae bacterium]
MFYDKQVDLYNVQEGTTNTITGVYKEGGPQYIKSIMCDIQPYSKEKLQKDYGYEIDVSKRIFCDLDDSIELTSVIKYMDLELEVKKIIEWDDYLEIFALEVM